MKIIIEADEKYPYYSAEKTEDDNKSLIGFFLVAEITEEEWGAIQLAKEASDFLQKKLSDLCDVAKEKDDEEYRKSKIDVD